MREDPIVREVREIRHEIESECEKDTGAFYEWLIASQQKLKGRLVRRKPRDMRRETRDLRPQAEDKSL